MRDLHQLHQSILDGIPKPRNEYDRLQRVRDSIREERTTEIMGRIIFDEGTLEKVLAKGPPTKRDMEYLRNVRGHLEIYRWELAWRHQGEDGPFR